MAFSTRHSVSLMFVWNNNNDLRSDDNFDGNEAFWFAHENREN